MTSSLLQSMPIRMTSSYTLRSFPSFCRAFPLCCKAFPLFAKLFSYFANLFLSRSGRYPVSSTIHFSFSFSCSQPFRNSTPSHRCSLHARRPGHPVRPLRQQQQRRVFELEAARVGQVEDRFAPRRQLLFCTRRVSDAITSASPSLREPTSGKELRSEEERKAGKEEKTYRAAAPPRTTALPSRPRAPRRRQVAARPHHRAVHSAARCGAGAAGRTEKRRRRAP